MLRIISHSEAPFADRQEAGQLLAEELSDLRHKNAVVLGIPRGGLVVAREIAHALNADLDIVLSRKLRAPGNPELALGALVENGELYLNEALMQQMRINPIYIEEEKRLQAAEIHRRSQLVRSVLPRVSLKGRAVVVTDDGIATGATMQAALWAVRKEGPRFITAALPVGPEETVRRLAADADDIVCLRTPPYFAAVGQFYARFNQVEDQDVLAILKAEKERPSRGSQPSPASGAPP
jgi:putative phosphoribosyl transferase